MKSGNRRTLAGTSRSASPLLPDSPFTRNYFISSHQHGTGNGASKGNCQQFLNPLNSAPVQRALFIALDEWASHHRRYPTFASYERRVVHAIREMVEDRLMLCEDAGDERVRLLAAGATAGVPAAPADFQAPPLCNGTKHHHGHGHGHDHDHDD